MTNRREAAKAQQTSQATGHREADAQTRDDADVSVRELLVAGGLSAFKTPQEAGMTAPVLDKIAYSITNFAKAVDLSTEKVRQHIERGELVASYVDSKPLIMREEGERWLRSRPAERPGQAA